MKEFVNRIPAQNKANWKQIQHLDENGDVTSTEKAIITYADEASVEGTPINRSSMLSLQGFQNNNIQITTVNGLKTIIETNADNHTLTTTFNADGTYTQVFTAGTNTITKTITFANGRIIEEVSGI